MENINWIVLGLIKKISFKSNNIKLKFFKNIYIN